MTPEVLDDIACGPHMTSTWTFVSRSEADTERLGAALAAALPDGATVALRGTLGAGKTRLVQALAVACGVERQDVVSPTFVLCQEYHGNRELVHLDAYRLNGADDLVELGVEEYFDSPALTLIEWADRVPECLPDERLEIEIDVARDGSRQMKLFTTGPSFAPVVQQVRARLGDA